MKEYHILIIGGGMCGLASAIALSQALTPTESSLSGSPSPLNPLKLRITVYELRKEPCTLGGPVNLTPKALRCLDILGVLDELKKMKAGCEVDSIEIFSLQTGKRLANIDYRGPEGNGFDGYKGWRVMRFHLLQAMLNIIQRTKNVEIVYGRKLVAVDEHADSATVQFEDGTSATGDFVMGCDGIHSAARAKFVQPDRVASYSGIAAAYGFTKIADVLDRDEKPFFQDTALEFSRYGSTLTTFCDHDRSQIYVVILMSMASQGSREGWKSIGKDQDAVCAEARRRTANSAILQVEKMIVGVQDWSLYPVYLLPPKGKWHTDRVLLLGDAAHAIPPKGESIGHCLEDALMFSSIVAHFSLSTEPKTSFAFYEKLRRQPMEQAYVTSSTGWMSNHDLGYLMAKVYELITPVFLWWTRKGMEKEFWDDPRNIDFSAM